MSVGRTLLVGFCLTLTIACTHLDRQRFTTLDHAGNDLIVAMNRSVTLTEFRTLVGTFDSALTDTKAHVSTSSERALVVEYEGAGQGLQDMLTVWHHRNEEQQELMPVTDPLAARLAKTYDLPVNTNEPTSIYASEALRALRDATKEKLEAAHTALVP
jgi:hypothetical protein